MKRFHVHVSVDDLEQSIRFYSSLFAAQPSVQKPDYAKWMLDDPRINFAISQRGREAGVDHLGFQVDDDAELDVMHERLRRAEGAILEEKNTACCYARSDKYWITDPSGIAWENFHTLGNVPLYGEEPSPTQELASQTACCGPAQAVKVAMPQPAAKACCGPAASA